MSLLDRKTELTELVFAAVRSVAERLDAKHKNKEIYSLIIYPSSGYRDLGISYSTNSELEKKSSTSEPGLDPDLLEMLKEHPDLMEKASTAVDSKLYFEVNACEWDGASSNTELFSEVNEIIGLEYDSLYDDGIDNSEICRFFETMLTDVLSEVKSSGMLNKPAFDDDVLLGVQFPDSGNSEAVRRISKVGWRLN